MSDYKEQVNLLREHADLIETSIELYGPSAIRLLVYDLRKAAAAIEDMAKHITEMHERVTVLQIARGELEAEVKRLKECNDELREAQTYIDHYGDKWLTSAKDVPTSAYNHGYMDGKNEAEQALGPKRGKWIEENRRPRSSQFVCSECHRTAYDPQPTRDKAWRKRCRYAYCPNCGAKMEVGI